MTDTPTTGTSQPVDTAAATGADASRDCPSCGTANPSEASFCEACGADLGDLAVAEGGPAGATAPAAGPLGAVGAVGAPGPAGSVAFDDGAVLAAAPPQTAPAGEESPLDVGWTGAVPSAAVAVVADDLLCHACGQGHIVDGYCDHCGTPPPNPRDHFVDVAGRLGRRGLRHRPTARAQRGRDVAQCHRDRGVCAPCSSSATASRWRPTHTSRRSPPRRRLAPCSTSPSPAGSGRAEAWASAAARALTNAVDHANDAVAASVVTTCPARRRAPSPPPSSRTTSSWPAPSATAASTGCPDAASEPARQLGRDDSFAQEQMTAGVPRLEAETGPHAHSITRWLGKDAPDDLTPHLTTVTATPSGWLMVCSDGLWNYCSEAEELRTLFHEAAVRLDAASRLDGADPTGARAVPRRPCERAGGARQHHGCPRQTGWTRIERQRARLPTAAAPVEGDPIDG